MGACCSNETQEDKETNFGKGTKLKTQGRAKYNMPDLNKIPLDTVVKVQAMIRGYLTRRMV
jgi:hypothetical protein